MLLFTERILSIHNGLPRGTLPLCLNVKPKCLCSGKHPDPVHLWMAARKKKLTHPLPEAGHSRGYLQNLWVFYFISSSPPPLCAIKETGIQTLIRRLFWDFSLPSSRSAGFPNKVVFPASTPRLRFIGLSCGEQSELGLGNVCVHIKIHCLHCICSNLTRKRCYVFVPLKIKFLLAFTGTEIRREKNVSIWKCFSNT